MVFVLRLENETIATNLEDYEKELDEAASSSLETLETKEEVDLQENIEETDTSESEWCFTTSP